MGVATEPTVGEVRELTVTTYRFDHDYGEYEVYFDNGLYMVLYWKYVVKRRDPYHVATVKTLDAAKESIALHRKWHLGRIGKSKVRGNWIL